MQLRTEAVQLGGFAEDHRIGHTVHTGLLAHLVAGGLAAPEFTASAVGADHETEELLRKYDPAGSR